MAKTIVQAELSGSEPQAWWGPILEDKVCVVLIVPQEIPDRETLEGLVKDGASSLLMLLVGDTDG